jgi:hypothetical protein
VAGQAVGIAILLGGVHAARRVAVREKELNHLALSIFSGIVTT